MDLNDIEYGDHANPPPVSPDNPAFMGFDPQAPLPLPRSSPNNNSRPNDSNGYESDVEDQEQPHNAIRFIGESINTNEHQVIQSFNAEKNNPEKQSYRKENPTELDPTIRWGSLQTESTAGANLPPWTTVGKVGGSYPIGNNRTFGAGGQFKSAQETQLRVIKSQNAVTQNRYISMGTTLIGNTTPKSKNDPMIISFGRISNKLNQQATTSAVPSTLPLSPQSNHRQRVKTETSSRTIVIKPSSIPPPTQVHWQVPQPIPKFINQSPPQVEIGRPGSFVGHNNYQGEVKTVVSFKNVGSHPTIQQPPHNALPTDYRQIVISSFPSTQLESLHLISPTASSNKIVAIEQWYTESITMYLQLSTKVQAINQLAHVITQLITVMLRDETEKQKHQFLKDLMQRQTLLEQKLAEAERQATQVIHHNNQLRSQLSTSPKLPFSPPRSDGIRQQSSEQNDKLRNELNAALSSNSQLSQALQDLKKANTDLISKNQTLQQSEGILGKEQQLTHTIENQKDTIKRLEQELNQTQNEYNTEKAERSKENTDGQEKWQCQQQKLMAILESKVAYINELQAEVIRYKTQIKSLKQIIKEKTEEGQMSQPIRQERSGTKSQILVHQSAISHKKSGTENTDINKLQKMITEKNAELDKVKDKIFEIQQQFDKVIDEKNDKIKELLQQIMIHKSKQVGEDTHQQPKKLIGDTESELSKLKNIIAKKDQELDTLHKTVMAKSNMESEVQQLRNQTELLQQNLKAKEKENEKLQQALSNLSDQLKSISPDTPKADSPEESVSTMLDTIKKKQMEIIKMRQTIEMQVESIRTMEEEIKDLTVKYKSVEQGLLDECRNTNQQPAEPDNPKEPEGKSQEKTHDPETAKQKNPVKELKKRTKETEETPGQLKGVDGVEQRDFRKQYSQSQVRIFELQSAVKNRQNKIRHLQSNIEQLKHKMGHRSSVEEDFVNQQEIEHLKKKLAEYEGRNTDSFMKSHRSRDHHFKLQSEQLRSLPHKANRHCMSAIQLRLQQFNKKLQQLMLQGPHLKLPLRFPKSSDNPELMVLLQRERTAIVVRYQQQIQMLQTRVQDLQRYCISLEQSPISDVNISCEGDRKEGGEKPGYYKDKNKQLEQRVNVLLKLDTELKDKYEQAIKGHSGYICQFHLQQISQLELRVVEYQAKLKEMAEEYGQSVKELEELRTAKESHTDIEKNLQVTIQGLNSKLLRLEQQGKHTTAKLSARGNEMGSLSAEVLRIRSELAGKEERLELLQQELALRNKKQAESEQQLARQQKQAEKLKGQLSRMQGELADKKNRDLGQSEQFKSRIWELEQEIGRMRRQSQAMKQEELKPLSQRYLLSQPRIQEQESVLSELNAKNREVQVSGHSQRGDIDSFTRSFHYSQQEKTGESSVEQQLLRYRQEKDQPEEITKLTTQIPTVPVRYHMELIRSLLLQLQVLLCELPSPCDPHHQQVLSQLSRSVGLALEGYQLVVAVIF